MFSETVPCTVGGCNADSVLLIEGQSEGGHWLDTGSSREMNCSRTDQSDSVVVNRSTSIILCIAPLNYNSDYYWDQSKL